MMLLRYSKHLITYPSHIFKSAICFAVVEIPDDQLKSKKSELRLYCDLLMQQVR